MELAQAQRGRDGLAKAFSINDLISIRGDFRNGHSGHGPRQHTDVDHTRRRSHGRSFEEPVRLSLRDAVGHKPSSRNLASIIRSHFGPDNGVDLELPPRDTGREPPAFD